MPAIAAISDTTLSLDAHAMAVADPRHGAISTFVGVVRNHDPSVDGEVTHLEYSAHPDAGEIIDRIAGEVEITHGVTIAVSHRIGMLAVGDPAIVVAAASAHRAEAFAACRDVVERVKTELPVWKREILADGSHTWVGVT